MKRGINKVIILGNVGQDPEMRYTPQGDPVANLSVATSEVWNDKNSGNQQEKTEWHRVVAFKKLAEIIGNHVKKGQKVYIEGRIQTRSWDQDGTKRYATEIIAEELQIVSGFEKRGDGEPVKPSHSEHKPASPPVQDNFDDDIPF